MKKLLNLDGVKALSKMEQKSISGGNEQIHCADQCQINSDCGIFEVCFSVMCHGDLTRLCR